MSLHFFEVLDIVQKRAKAKCPCLLTARLSGPRLVEVLEALLEREHRILQGAFIVELPLKNFGSSVSHARSPYLHQHQGHHDPYSMSSCEREALN